MLFSLEPEKAHRVVLTALKLLQTFKLLPNKPPQTWQPCTLFGLSFPNPVGLAAGLDKNGECLRAWQALNFGFIEVGTVTPKAQPGNPSPRLFRLIEDYALINRMGFNNKGIDALIEKIKRFSLHCPLGVNIGKNRDTPLQDALTDYLISYQKVYPYADYVTVNLSSPNTPGLTSLQNEEALKKLVQGLKNEQTRLQDKYHKNVPLLVKVSPDLAVEDIHKVVHTLVTLQVEGIIATNTTLKRSPYLQSREAYQEGGLSGAPLFEQSTAFVRTIYQYAGETLPIIAVGGIMDATQAQEKFAAGAKLIQLYSGLIYRGPSLIKEILACKRAKL